MSYLLAILWLVWVEDERLAAAGLLLPPYNDTCRDAQVLREPRVCGVVRATRQGELTLLNGFTIVRDLGTEGTTPGNVSLRRATDTGITPGPHLLISTRELELLVEYGMTSVAVPESGTSVNTRVFYPDE